MDTWLRAALTNVPERLKTIKLTVINAFAMTLRRYTSLNHLAQAARAVLQNSTQVNQMLADLNKVDFHNIQVRLFVPLPPPPPRHPSHRVGASLVDL